MRISGWTLRSINGSIRQTNVLACLVVLNDAGGWFGLYKMVQKPEKNYRNRATWVLIWEYSERAFQWIPTYQGIDVFQKYSRPCALVKVASALEGLRINGLIRQMYVIAFLVTDLPPPPLHSPHPVRLIAYKLFLQLLESKWTPVVTFFHLKINLYLNSCMSISKHQWEYEHGDVNV